MKSAKEAAEFIYKHRGEVNWADVYLATNFSIRTFGKDDDDRPERGSLEDEIFKAKHDIKLLQDELARLLEIKDEKEKIDAEYSKEYKRLKRLINP